jgi:hypothetical protein
MEFTRRTGRAIPALALPALALTSLISLAGCSWFQDDPTKGAACPTVGTVPELARVSRFQGTDTNFNHLTYRATLDDVKASCKFDGVNHVTVSATVNLLAERGPAGKDGVQDFNYFVALSDDAGNIMAKNNFSAPLTFKPGQGRAGSSEGPITVPISISDPKAAAGYHVVMGFQLTPAERAYNGSTAGGM